MKRVGIAAGLVAVALGLWSVGRWPDARPDTPRPSLPDEAPGREPDLKEPEGVVNRIRTVHDDRSARPEPEGGTRVPELLTSEGREPTIELRMFARVVSSPGDRALPGARVELKGIGHRGYKPSEELVTDGEGLVELTVSSPGYWHGEVKAAGYGPMLFPFEGGHESADEALILRMSESAGLHGRIVDPSRNPVPGVTVELSIEASQLLPNRLLRLDWSTSPWLFKKRKWKARTTEAGTFRIDPLPAGVDLDFSISVQGRIERKGVGALRLNPGKIREVEWRIGDGVKLLGRAIDRNGAPASGSDMWLVHGDSQRYFAASELNAEATTDREGRFFFENVPPGRWLVGPAPEHGERGVPNPEALAPWARVVEVVEGPGEQEVQVIVHRGLYVVGRVVDPGGAPVAYSIIQGQSPNYAQADDKGRFAFGPLAPGPVDLIAAPTPQTEFMSPSKEVTALPGDAGVVLELQVGSQAFGSTFDRQTGARRTAMVWLKPAGATLEEKDTGWRGPAFTGEFSFYGIPPGVYDLVATDDDGRFGMLEDVLLEGGVATEGLVIEMER